jgi:ribosomal protein S1
VSQVTLAWQRITQIQAEDVTVYGEVVSSNRGGLLVLVEGLRGFVPSSHLGLVRSDFSPARVQSVSNTRF